MRSLAVLLLVGCSSSSAAPPPGPLPELPRAASPRFDEVFTLATHNSYWVDRGVKGDAFASGTSERILDQLFYDRARSLEFDIHKNLHAVYHTEPGNSVCPDLHACLAQVEVFRRVHWNHEPLVIVLELKELTGPNFDEKHTPAELDAAIREAIGGLFTPADLLATCPGSTTLADCTRRARWPSFESLRGRVLVALIGNWDELGNAQATKDWAVYAADAPHRIAFPMASPWKLDASTFTPRMQDIVTQAELDAAWEQSAFVQIEDLADPHAEEALARGSIVRVDGAITLADQRARIARHFQLLQTDTPEIREGDRGFAFGWAPATPPQRGTRHLLDPSDAGTFAYAEGTTPFELWSTTVVSGHDRRRVGCLRGASSREDPSLASITVCRVKLATEEVTMTVEICENGSCATQTLAEAASVGDQIAIDYEGANCVTAMSKKAELSWKRLATTCFSRPLAYRGIYRPPAPAGSGPVLFVETTRKGAPVTALQGPVIDASTL